MPVHYRTCNLCEAMCGLEIEHQGEDIIAIRGDKNDPLSKGHICPKGVAIQDLHHDPDRLRQPMKRVGNDWQPISWDQAFSEVAERLVEVQKQHGRHSVAFYAGNPTVHNHGALLTLLPFIKNIGTRNRYSATSLDQLPHMLAGLQLFGGQLSTPVPDIDRTDYLLTFGANPVVSNGSLMTAPGFRDRAKAIKARGGKLVVVDPRRTETAKIASDHLFIKPGADVYFLLAMLQIMFSGNHVNLRHVQQRIVGLDELKAQVMEWTPEKVAPLCGIDAEKIKAITDEFIQAERAVAYSRIGVCTVEMGSLAAYLVYVVNIISGNFDREGGMMFTSAAIDTFGFSNLAGQSGSFGRYHSRVRGLPEFGGDLPMTTMAEDMLVPGEGQIKALVTHAGNPVLSCPDGQNLDKAFGQLDFMVSIDLVINETTRHADYILPPTGHLEHGHYDLIFHGFAVRNTVKYSPPLFQASEDALHDWQILIELSRALDKARGKLTRSKNAVYKWTLNQGDEGLLDWFLKLGPYGQVPFGLDKASRVIGSLPLLGQLQKWLASKVPSIENLAAFGQWSNKDKPLGGLTLDKVKMYPHGFDLGPLRPGLTNRVVTKNGEINLLPDIYRPIFEELKSFEISDGLLMIGRRDTRSNNSWMHNSRRLVKGKNRCDVLIHPNDAQVLGISQGQLVELIGEAGRVQLPATITEDIMPGVVCAPHGWGHHRDGVKMDIAQSKAGVSVNDVMGVARVERLSGMAVLNGVPVSIEPVAQAAAG